MKSLSILALMLIVKSAFALNYSPNSVNDITVRDEKRKISAFVLSMEGVNGIGITACDEKTGVIFTKLDSAAKENSLFVNCIDITTETKDAETALLKLFPLGTTYNHIPVIIEFVGKIRPL